VALAVPAVAALVVLDAVKPEPLPATASAPSSLTVQPAQDLTPWLGLSAAGSAAAQPAEQSEAAPSGQEAASPAERPERPAIAWRKSQAIGVPHSGRLVNGVRLPVAGPDWVTWDPVLHRVPNRPTRLAGTDTLVRLVLDVIRDYRLAHPKAPKVVIGDLSRVRGGEIDEHVSHENGLDVDVYYPRRDRKLRPPRTVSQIDVRLTRDLLDRFVAAGASVVFVGWSTPLRSPAGVVVPYANHDNHMHVRIGNPG
jgi:murein endopeptidase